MRLTLVLLFILARVPAMAAQPVEHDPGAWAFTTGFTAGMVGTFTRPWIGFAAGSAVGVLSNLQDSNNARQNMVGSIAGAAVGYVVIKTLKHDWPSRAHRAKGDLR